MQVPGIRDSRRRQDSRWRGATALTRRERLERRADFVDPGAGDLLDDPAIAEEDQVRPELDAERPAERPARPVLDLDVADIRVIPKQPSQFRSQRPAERAPARAKLK